MIKLSKDQNLVSSFIPGDFVVYPSHGVGKIIGTEKRKVEDLELELLVVRFEHERMTLRVPLSKAKESGLRTLSSNCLLYTSPSPRDLSTSRMPSSA